jgi:putative transposase
MYFRQLEGTAFEILGARFERCLIPHAPDESSQFTSIDSASFLKQHNLEHSMSRHGNCHENAVAESLFNFLKCERAKRKTYKTRDNARQDIFGYIEMFYNQQRKHTRNDMLLPVEFETRQKLKPQSVYKLGGIQAGL